MMEELARQRDRQVRALNIELAVNSLSVYGLITALAHLNTPETLTVPAAIALGAACAVRWLHRRWEVQALDAAVR